VQVFTTDQWNALDSFATDSGRFCGLAIGPESHEAIVRVGPLLLQAGRVLALPSNNAPYVLLRNKDKVPSGNFAEIARLQVVCFECQEELACEVARPTGTFSTVITGVDVSASVWPAVTAVLDLPFIGRRQAMLSLNNTDVSKVGVTITGRRYNASKRAVETQTLVTVNPGDFTGTVIAEHVGGTNEAEVWHALRISAGLAAGGAGNVFADVECIGEIGAR